MKRNIISAIILTAMLSGGAAMAQKKNGWVKLFDGKTTQGWHTYGKNTAGTAWKAEKGALRFDPKADKAQRGDIVTDKEYSNFHLKLEWKVAPKSNSGIMLFVHEEPSKYRQTYSTGLEMQVLDNEGHPDGKITKHRAGDLYDLIKSSSEPVKPVGQWNKVEVVSNNGKLDFTLNGVKIVSTTMWDENWKNMIAGSKFATWENFGTFKSGKIALQDHGDEVWYRNISIKEL
ncbi:3-keto-disaccharide hydrolase [Pedobacter immunditicola]|uniref:3-keto-disaccharide hydrolase n=1 Tax=Pedobacter immunditicola TaxID=3133440 RepID=UPI0030AB1B0C